MENLEHNETETVCQSFDREAWYKKAYEQTADTLGDFVKSVMAQDLDYGTVCEAVATCAIAAIHAANETENGGVTGFQMGAIMWQIIREMNYRDNASGLKIINYDEMLFPQYEYHFDKKIRRDIWEALQAEAKRRLEDIPNKSYPINPHIESHWKSIVDGKVPFGFTIDEN